MNPNMQRKPRESGWRENEQLLEQVRLLEAHAGWLKLEKYQGLATRSLKNVFYQFALRIDLFRAASLFAPPARPPKELAASVEAYSCILDTLYHHALPSDEIVKEILDQEELIAPESFQAAGMYSSEGIGIRSFSVRDYLLLNASLDKRTLEEPARTLADQTQQSWSTQGRFPSFTERNAARNLDRPIKEMTRPALFPHNLSHLTIDLSLPESLILEQMRLLIARERGSSFIEPWSAKQHNKPKIDDWEERRILPYIDLMFWLRNYARPGLCDQISLAAIARFLDTDADRLSDTRDRHVTELTDFLSIPFRSLLECAIGEEWGPRPPIRKSRAASSIRKNKT